MATLEKTRTGQDRVAEKIKKVQELYADAPEVGRVALKNGLEALKHELAAAPGRQNAGRIGARQGRVSELTAIIPLVPGGGKRIRGLLDLLEGNFQGADLVGNAARTVLCVAGQRHEAPLLHDLRRRVGRLYRRLRDEDPELDGHPVLQLRRVAWNPQPPDQGLAC
jgi:hypothetical protein